MALQAVYAPDARKTVVSISQSQL